MYIFLQLRYIIIVFNCFFRPTFSRLILLTTPSQPLWCTERLYVMNVYLTIYSCNPLFDNLLYKKSIPDDIFVIMYIPGICS